MFKRKKKAGPVAALFLALLYGSVFTIIASVDLFLAPSVSPGEPLAFSVRIPQIGLYSETMTTGASYRFGGLRKGPGEVLDPRTHRLVRTYEAARRPPGAPFLAGLGLGFATVLFFFSTALRRQAGAAHLRAQFVLFGALLLLVIVAKALLMLTTWSPMWLPAAMLVIPVTVLIGSAGGAATAVASACAMSLLTPIDLSLLAVLLGQGLAVSAAARKNAHAGNRAILAGVYGALGGTAAYFAATLLLERTLPPAVMQLSLGFELLASDPGGAFLSPLICGFLGLAIIPALEHLLGRVSKAKLVALADLENPLLKRLASVAPGTWAHSLNMANMAEVAANTTGANALLVRVGAYYHDIGKTVQPEYFIENQEGKNPHDELEPLASADAIFSHVIHGTKLARRAGLPESLVEFIYTHHGNSLLEYFWHKALRQSQGRPEESEEEFRYPGIPPQNRECAILALCDSVEAASKSIKDPDLEQIRQLVRQILFTKLEQGMLDESGLTVQDLHKITESLVETLRSAMHVRVRYPWQDASGRGKREQLNEPEQPERPDAVPAPFSRR